MVASASSYPCSIYSFHFVAFSFLKIWFKKKGKVKSCGLDIDDQNPTLFYEKKLKTRWQRKWDWGQVKGPQQKKSE